MLRTLVTRGKDSELIELMVADVAAGEQVNVGGDDETAVVILRGHVDVQFGDGEKSRAGGRDDVFEGAGHAVYLPFGQTANLTGASDASIAIASVPAEGRPHAPARIIAPDDQRIQGVGMDNWSREVRTMLGPEHEAQRMMLGETINPPGNWSSYPPHKHDRHDPPHEVKLEEIYFFKVRPEGGFGIQIIYDDRESDVLVVKDGDVAVISHGYHPVVAGGGYELYYLWILAGESREMAIRYDPAHEWVQQGA